VTRKGTQQLATAQQEAARKRAFLEAYAERGNVNGAARDVGIDRSAHYRWLKEDVSGEYRAAFVEAEGKAADALEQEARRRALIGTEKPVYQNGQLVGSIREYSDTLLIFLMKGAMPHKYRERVDVNIDARVLAVRIAAEMGDGLDPDALLAEAERLVAGG
jgi:hypothetical protein